MLAQTSAQATSELKLADIAAIIGMILGTAGFIMSWMNYLRDRPRIKISLQWDMTNSHTGALMGLVRVANVGRRPVFLSIVALKVPKGFDNSHLVLHESIQGRKLEEGNAPAGFIVNYDGLAQYSRSWWKLRAYAEDSAGQKYLSKPLAKTSVPSWVRPSGADE
jgi:hypothetical protein